MRAKEVIFIHLLLLGLAATAFFLGRATKECAGETIVERVDTLVIRDTSSFVGPQTGQKPDVLIKEIPVPVYVADSTAIDSLLNECARLERVGDSLQLVLLRVQRHYSDSTFDAWVSGVDPRLDSIKTYRSQIIITKEIPVNVQSRWGIGVQGGVGVGKDGLTPYVGVGVSYNLISW